MLTLHYNGYRVHIDDTGSAEYTLLDDDGPGRHVVTNDPPAEIVLLAGSILQLVATDVMKAEMRVARAKEAVRIVTEDVVKADYAESEAKVAGLTARSARIALSATLKVVEGALQTVKSKQ